MKTPTGEQVTALVGESYERAYKGVVCAQQVSSTSPPHAYSPTVSHKSLGFAVDTKTSVSLWTWKSNGHELPHCLQRAKRYLAGLLLYIQSEPCFHHR